MAEVESLQWKDGVDGTWETVENEEAASERGNCVDNEAGDKDGLVLKALHAMDEAGMACADGRST